MRALNVVVYMKFSKTLNLIFSMIFSFILYLFFDISLFPVSFYGTLNHIGLLMLSVVVRAVIASSYYFLVVEKVDAKVFAVSIAINGLPLQFSEALLLNRNGIVDPILAAKYGGILNSFMISFTSYCAICVLVVALIFELPRLFAGYLIVKNLS